MTLQEALIASGVDEDTTRLVVNTDYCRDADPRQDNANFLAAATAQCEELLGFDRTAEVLFHRSCCKSGSRLTQARKLAKEHGDKPLPEKLALLGQLRYMGSPSLDDNGDIVTVAVGSPGTAGMACPCWQLGGRAPAGASMPLSYCLCCAGHFRFHYEAALGLSLKPKKVLSSILNSGEAQPCVFVYSIEGTKPKRAGGKP